MKINKIAWIGLMLVLIMVLSAASCQRRPVDINDSVDLNGEGEEITEDNGEDSSEGDTDSNIPSPSDSGLSDSEAIYPQLISEKDTATEFIRLIQTDAVLTMVSMKYINSLSNTFGLSTNYYIFRSPTNTEYWFLVNVPRNQLDFGYPAPSEGDINFVYLERGMKRFLMPVEDFGLKFDILPVPFEYWQINYAKALELAEAQGGGGFRAQHKTFEVSVILARPAGGYHLKWFITYKATDGTGARWQVQVHANTGEVQIV